MVFEKVMKRLVNDKSGVRLEERFGLKDEMKNSVKKIVKEK